MKKTLLFATALLLSVSAYAQKAVGSWTIQPKAGINLATMTNDNDAKTRLGLVAGAELQYQATPLFYLSAGALYSQQGCETKSEGIDGTLKMDYINIPILANLCVADGLALKIGIQPGFLINDKVEVSANGVSAEIGLKESYRAAGLDADVSSLDFAIPLGVSYEINNFVLEARYNCSLSKAISLLGESTKHSVFQLTLGYKFGL